MGLPRCQTVANRLTTYLAAVRDHDVVRMTVPDAEHVSGYAISGTGVSEVLDGLLLPEARTEKQRFETTGCDPPTVRCDARGLTGRHARPGLLATAPLL